MTRLKIAWLDRAAATDGEVVAHVTKLINDVYAVAESGLWVEGATRTTEEEVVHLIGSGEIVVAELDHRIVGCMRIHFLDATTADFGMLAADPGHRGTGIGRELFRFAEGEARRMGADMLQLELLVPRDWTHPSKEFLLGWYTRIGYVMERI